MFSIVILKMTTIITVASSHKHVLLCNSQVGDIAHEEKLPAEFSKMKAKEGPSFLTDGGRLSQALEM